MRITVDEVKDAYLRTGLKPIQGYYGDCRVACALGALAARKGGPRTWAAEAVIGERGLTLAYRDGFLDGFDGVPRHAFGPREQVDYLMGKEDGQACWEAVK